MRAVLEFTSGARRGQTVALEAGHALSVGRTSRAELVCDDPMMSGVHFRVEADALGFYLYDEMSRNGTFVDGQRVGKCVLLNGNAIVAGETTFRVRVEGDNPKLASTTRVLPWVQTDIPDEEVRGING